MGVVCFKSQQQPLKIESETNFFNLKANDITGHRIDFYIYKNRGAFLLVNVASNCKLAKENYRMLNQLYQQYRQHGLEIMAFPCNQFGNSQPKDNEEIYSIVREKYFVEFTLFEKIEVNGARSHPVYKYLRSQPLLVNEKTGKSKLIPGNFTICLLNKEGKLVRYFKPSKEFEELKKSIKRILTHERLTTKKLITSRSIKY